ncbi:MAG TPA: SRPBCC domain-containing protein [Acidimicrobiia bacterium]|nr:SRPBCC domain-containing protein [Acidimicrobiia bacterium]
MSGTDSVTVSIDVAVDPDTAFEVFTKEIDSWYQRGPYSWRHPDRAVGIRFEPYVGGRLLEVHDRATGEGFAFGEVLVWEPGARLVFADLVSSAPPDPLTEVEVRFEAAGGGTRVTLEHRGLDQLPPDVAAQKRMYGWQTTLRWFEEHMDKETRW